MLALNAGIGLPLIIGFIDIVLRSALQGHIAPFGTLAVSFSVQFLGYLLGFFFVWKWLLGSYTFKETKALLRQGTAALLLTTLIFFGFLFRIDNMLSNTVWILFYAIVIMMFYLIGRRTIRIAQNP